MGIRTGTACALVLVAVASCGRRGAPLPPLTAAQPSVRVQHVARAGPDVIAFSATPASFITVDWIAAEQFFCGPETPEPELSLAPATGPEPGWLSAKVPEQRGYARFRHSESAVGRWSAIPAPAAVTAEFSTATSDGIIIISSTPVSAVAEHRLGNQWRLLGPPTSSLRIGPFAPDSVQDLRLWPVLETPFGRVAADQPTLIQVTIP